jgi:hypothetical protein
MVYGPLAMSWFDRMDGEVGAGRLVEHARRLRAEGLPPARVALVICVFFPRELRVRGRAGEVAGVLEQAPAALEALGIPVPRLEQALRDRALTPLVLELHEREGWSKAHILAALKSFSVLLTARGRDDEAVLAVLDRLTGFAAREDQLWPDEVDEL